jgi:hypothetical protein
MEDVVKRSDYIKGFWRMAYFYETNYESATVYTARFKGWNYLHLEWALHQFSGTSELKKFQGSRFVWTGAFDSSLVEVYAIHKSRVVITLSDKYVYERYHYVIHSMASSSQRNTPRNIIKFDNAQLPISALKSGLKCFGPEFVVYCDEPFDDDQIIHSWGFVDIIILLEIYTVLK